MLSVRSGEWVRRTVNVSVTDNFTAWQFLARINDWSSRVDSSVYTSGGFLLTTNSINDTLLFWAHPMCSEWAAGVMCRFRWHTNEIKIKRLTTWLLGLRPAFEHAEDAGFVQLHTLIYAPFPLSNICRTQAACHWTNRAMVTEGEAVFGHICHEEWGPELVLYQHNFHFCQ